MMAYALVDEDADAEHEDDPMMDDGMFIPRHATLNQQKANLLPTDVQDAEGGVKDAVNDADAEGEEDDEAEDEKEDEAVGPAKQLAQTQDGDDVDNHHSALQVVEEPVASVEETVEADVPSDENVSENSSSGSDSDALAEWEEPTDDQDDEDEGAETNCCMYA